LACWQGDRLDSWPRQLWSKQTGKVKQKPGFVATIFKY
jgi:hypothetical protein